jgi:hypothetical protein
MREIDCAKKIFFRKPQTTYFKSFQKQPSKKIFPKKKFQKIFFLELIPRVKLSIFGWFKKKFFSKFLYFVCKLMDQPNIL